MNCVTFLFFFLLIDLFNDLLTNFRAKLSALSILDFSLNSFFLFFFLGGEFFFFFSIDWETYRRFSAVYDQ